MKSLIVLLFALISNLGTHSNNFTIDEKGCPPPVVENIIFDWDEDCSGVTYTIVLCNNSLCTSSSGVLNLAFLPAPKDDMFIQHNFNQIPPQSCITFTGSIRASSAVNVTAMIEGAPDADTFELYSKC